MCFILKIKYTLSLKFVPVQVRGNNHWSTSQVRLKILNYRTLYASIFLSVLICCLIQFKLLIQTALNSMIMTHMTWLVWPTWGRFFSKTIENIFLNFLGQIPLTIQSCDKLKELVEIDREWEYFVKILWLTWLWN